MKEVYGKPKIILKIRVQKGRWSYKYQEMLKEQGEMKVKKEEDAQERYL